MDVLKKILMEIWMVTVQMSPYLLFGFLMAGVLSVLISKEYVQRHLGGSGWKPSIKAALVGVPMPICSCGVIPLAASLRKHGASRSATASFLASTPQTGVDSLMITYALLGWFFALFRAVVAFLSGILCGVAVGAVSSADDAAAPEPCTDECCSDSDSNIFKRAFTYGFISLPRDIGRAMLLGIIVSGIISGVIPENYFADKMGDSFGAMLLMLCIGIPLYVCSSGSVPIALAFIKAGISPGAALIFLITGPATNAATLTTLWKIIGKRQLMVFLITLSLCALGAGLLMNYFGLHMGIKETVCTQMHDSHIVGILCAVILLPVLANGLMPQRKK